MILFASFSHIWILFLFIYLGLCSGIIFFFTSLILEKLKLFLLKPRKKQERKTSSLINFVKEDIEQNSEENEKSKQNLKQKNKIREKFKKIFKKNKQNLKEPSNKKLLFIRHINLPKNETKNKAKNENKKEKKEKSNKNYFKIFYYKYLKKLVDFVLSKLCKFKKVIINISYEAIRILILLSVIVVSFIINLQLNFGYLRFSFVLIYVAFFLIAKSVINLLANYFSNFYNYFKNIKGTVNKKGE